jgi:hypothetical protein
MLREGNFKEGRLPDMIATEDATGINAGNRLQTITWFDLLR